MYTMFDSLGWTFPKEFLTEGFVQDDDTGDTEDHEWILVDKVVEIATRMWKNELVTETGEWVDKVWEALKVSEVDWIESGEEPYTEEDMLDMIHHWVDEELNMEIEGDAQRLLDSKLDGSYWDGEH
jgi:hypothetical protein